MITAIIAFIKGLQLTLTQWLVVGVAAAIAAAVEAFRLQGQALHKAQVQLLEQNIKLREGQDQTATVDAVYKYHQALAAYYQAGGRL